jgi:hypothetical protein
MSTGQTYEVRHPEMALLTRTEMLVGVGETDEGVPAEFKSCALLHVTAVEPVPARQSPWYSIFNPVGANTVQDAYSLAQHAMADLKAAVYAVLADAPPQGLTNAEIGRSLGIYAGHVEHEGHISRTLLALMEKESVVQQVASTKRCTLRRHGSSESGVEL